VIEKQEESAATLLAPSGGARKAPLTGLHARE